MQTRERIHLLIDELPEGKYPAVERLLAARGGDRDPFLRALANAPADDAPSSPEDGAAIQEGLDAIARGEVVSQTELRRALRL